MDYLHLMFIHFFIVIPIQTIRFFRYNLFPTKCPKCTSKMEIKFLLWPQQVKGWNKKEYKLIPQVQFDYIICENTKCTHFKNLEEKTLRKQMR